MKLSLSTKIFLFLIFVYALCSATYIYLPAFSALPISAQELPAPKIVIAFASFILVFLLYGSLGLIGLRLSKKIGFPELWDKKITNKERFIAPAVIGVILGIFFIIIDSLVNLLTSYGELPHPAFPASLLASLSAAIGEEVIFRLFFISFWVWLITHFPMKTRGKSVVFWLVTVWAALVFSAGHLPSVMVLKGLTSPMQIPPLILGEIFLLNSAISIPAAYLFRKNGILAAMGVHFWADIIWHVLYG